MEFAQVLNHQMVRHTVPVTLSAVSRLMTAVTITMHSVAEVRFGRSLQIEDYDLFVCSLDRMAG